MHVLGIEKRVLEEESERAQGDAKMDANPFFDESKRIEDRMLGNLKGCYLIER